MKVVFAGGVTGGHIAPGVALAEKIAALCPGSEVLFASVANKTETRMIAGRGLRLARVAARDSGLASAAVHVPGALLRARRVLASFKPDVVVGLGGGASLGGALAAITMRKPLVLLEQNVIPGRANRRLARWADCVCCQWQSAAAALGGRAAFTGSPVRTEIISAQTLDKPGAKKFFGLDPGRPVLLVTGGSQGAGPINAAMMKAAGALARSEVQVLHLAGERDAATLLDAYRAAGLPAHVTSFLETMHLACAAADFAMSRAGATSIAEFAAAGLPAILVPYPQAKDDHQRANALEAARQGWAVMVDQADLAPEDIAALIGKAASEAPQLAQMRQKALASAVTDASDTILDIMTGLSAGEESMADLAAERNIGG